MADNKTQKHAKLQQTLGLDIPPGAIKKSLNNHINGHWIHVKDQLNIYKDTVLKPGATDEAKAATLKSNADYKKCVEALDALSGKKIRFSQDVFYMLSAICGEVFESVIANAVEVCVKHDDSVKRVLPRHLQWNGAAGTKFCELPYFPLVHVLKSARSLPVDAPEEDDAADATPEVEDDTKFTHHVDRICKRLKASKPEEYAALKVSGAFKEYCNVLIHEFLQYIAESCSVLREFNKMSTITDETVKVAFRLMLVNHQDSWKKLSAVIDEKMTAYEDALNKKKAEGGEEKKKVRLETENQKKAREEREQADKKIADALNSKKVKDVVNAHYKAIADKKAAERKEKEEKATAKKAEQAAAREAKKAEKEAAKPTLENTTTTEEQQAPVKEKPAQPKEAAAKPKATGKKLAGKK